MIDCVGARLHPWDGIDVYGDIQKLFSVLDVEPHPQCGCSCLKIKGFVILSLQGKESNQKYKFMNQT